MVMVSNGGGGGGGGGGGCVHIHRRGQCGADGIYVSPLARDPTRVGGYMCYTLITVVVHHNGY